MCMPIYLIVTPCFIMVHMTHLCLLIHCFLSRLIISAVYVHIKRKIIEKFRVAVLRPLFPIFYGNSFAVWKKLVALLLINEVLFNTKWRCKNTFFKIPHAYMCGYRKVYLLIQFPHQLFSYIIQYNHSLWILNWKGHGRNQLWQTLKLCHEICLRQLETIWNKLSQIS
jgi:hypothetical protein